MPKTAKRTSARRDVSVSTRAVKDGDRRIVLKTRENPRRAGTTQFDRYEVIRRYNNKTVTTFIKKGGNRIALTRAQNEGHVALGK